MYSVGPISDMEKSGNREGLPKVQRRPHVGDIGKITDDERVIFVGLEWM